MEEKTSLLPAGENGYIEDFNPRELPFPAVV